LKIDRSFLRDQASVADNPILRCIVELGHELGLTVVAEGVERESALRAVMRLGCDQVQGYYFSRPLAPHDFREWMAESSFGASGQGATGRVLGDVVPARRVSARAVGCGSRAA
jgi:EAL domain-containing protein (putative c-di-GMP-specific phosphodiesterase class I)